MRSDSFLKGAFRSESVHCFLLYKQHSFSLSVFSVPLCQGVYEAPIHMAVTMTKAWASFLLHGFICLSSEPREFAVCYANFCGLPL